MGSGAGVGLGEGLEVGDGPGVEGWDGAMAGVAEGSD